MIEDLSNSSNVWQRWQLGSKDEQYKCLTFNNMALVCKGIKSSKPYFKL